MQEICTKGVGRATQGWMPGVVSGTRSCRILPVRWEDSSAEPIRRQCLICKIASLKTKFINALEDWEILMKLRESGPKTLDKAVSCALQNEHWSGNSGRPQRLKMQLQYQIKQLRLMQWTAVTEHGFKVGEQLSFSQSKKQIQTRDRYCSGNRTRAAQPAQWEVQGSSKATICLWVQWNWLLLENGVLYRQWQIEDDRGTKLHLELPRMLVPDVLSALHDAPSAGHLGLTKTVERVWEVYKDEVSSGYSSSTIS